MSSAPYGPATLQIRRFLQRLAALRPSEWDAAAAAFAAAQGSAAFRGADRALADAIARTGREPERDAALGPLVQLVRAPGTAPVDGPEEVPLAPVAEAALAAVLALLVRDVLPAPAFATLYAPFATVVPVAELG